MDPRRANTHFSSHFFLLIHLSVCFQISYLLKLSNSFCVFELWHWIMLDWIHSRQLTILSQNIVSITMYTCLMHYENICGHSIYYLFKTFNQNLCVQLLHNNLNISKIILRYCKNFANLLVEHFIQDLSKFGGPGVITRKSFIKNTDDLTTIVTSWMIILINDYEKKII